MIAVPALELLDIAGKSVNLRALPAMAVLIMTRHAY